MASKYDFNAPRLHVESDLGVDARIELNRDQANYLRTVLRLKDGDRILAFDGRNGEWACLLESPTRKTSALRALEPVRPQTRASDLDYLFAPLKQARQDYIAQKAVEMGVSRLRPIITRRTQMRAPNLQRMRANAIEAAEQCGVLNVPTIEPTASLDDVLAAWPADRALIFCDEDAPVRNPLEALRALGAAGSTGRRQPRSLAVLIGPEGGFEPREREALARVPSAVVLSLGPRILRADTAAVAALTLAQAALGDWREDASDA